jgi:DNA-binding transcriptional LysR family regulator
MNILDGIDVFAKVVQCGSFSAAARLMAMPVTTVSGKVAHLERRLGVTLIHRTTRKLNLTDAGQAYYEHCLKALAEMSQAESTLLNAKIEPQGLLRITAPADVGHLLLPPLVRQYLKQYPLTQVELMLTNRMVDLVGEGVDLAIRAGTLKDSSLVTRKFLDLELSLWASTSYAKRFGLPKHPRDLHLHAFVAFKAFGESLKFSGDRSHIAANVKARITVDDIEAVKVFILGGDGIGALSPLICQPEITAGKIVRVLPAWSLEMKAGARGLLSFVYPAQRFLAPKIQAFIELATHAAP